MSRLFHQSLVRALCALCLGLAVATSAHAQLETRGSRDAAGIRSQIEESGEKAPSLEELSAAYDRASASWMEVFGSEPFLPALQGARAAVADMRRMGWAPDAFIAISMLDARGDAAWEEAGSCRAQLNIGSDGASPIAKVLGNGGFHFQAAHEIAHCLYDQTSIPARLPSVQSLLAPSFPLRLSPKLARAFIDMTTRASGEDGSLSMVESYDEALADAIGAAATLTSATPPRAAIERALAARMGAVYLTLRRDTPPPAHLGGYALWRSLGARGPARTLAEARALAAASVLTHALASRAPPRWAEAFKAADPAAYKRAQSQAQALHAAITQGRDIEADETLYMSVSTPALFVMDLDGAPERKTGAIVITPAQSLDNWRAAAWLKTGK